MQGRQWVCYYFCAYITQIAAWSCTSKSDIPLTEVHKVIQDFALGLFFFLLPVSFFFPFPFSLPVLLMNPRQTGHMSPVLHGGNAHRQAGTFEPTSYLSHLSAELLVCGLREEEPTRQRVEHETRCQRGDTTNRWEAAPQSLTLNLSRSGCNLHAHLCLPGSRVPASACRCKNCFSH